MSIPLGWICNPTVMSISICNAQMCLHYQIVGGGISALKMLILHDVGLQIRLSGDTEKKNMLLSCYQQGEQHVPYQDDRFWLLAVGLQPLKLFTFHYSLHQHLHRLTSRSSLCLNNISTLLQLELCGRATVAVAIDRSTADAQGTYLM